MESGGSNAVELEPAKETRIHRRRPYKADGFIALQSGFQFPVETINLSARGARLRLKASVILPDRFVLEVFSPDDTKIKRCECARRWQTGLEVGVRFISSQIIPLA